MRVTRVAAMAIAVCIPGLTMAQTKLDAASPAAATTHSLPVIPVTVTGTPTVKVVNFPTGTASGATPLAPTRPSDLITLRSSGALCGTSPWKSFNTRVNPDGTLSPYTIPTGKVLVVTSVDWRQGSTSGVGQGDEFFLFPSEANINVNYAIVDSVASTSGTFAGTSIVVTGVSIKAGHACWGVNNLDHIGSADALLHGFLADDN